MSLALAASLGGALAVGDGDGDGDDAGEGDDGGAGRVAAGWFEPWFTAGAGVWLT